MKTTQTQKHKAERARPLILIGLGSLLVLASIVIFSLSGNPRLGGAATATSTPTVALLNLNGPYPEIPRVRIGDAKAAYDLKTAIFLDTREADIFSALHIPGAINIPFEETEARLGELDKTSWIIPYCT